MLYVSRTLLVVTVLLGFAAAACGGGGNVTDVAPGLRPVTDVGREVDPVNRIAYVSPSGDLFTVDPDGSGLAQLTGGLQAERESGGHGSLEQGSEGSIQAQPLRLNEYYTWPTWSADGTRLAASRVVVREDRTDISLEVLDARTGRSETVYVNDQAGLIAEGAPHYIYWAPSGDALSFLVVTPDGLALFVWDGTPGNAADLVQRGAPLYFQWSNDAKVMALHVGADITLARTPFGSTPVQTFQSSGGFRVPAISPDGTRLAYVAATEEGAGLYVAPINDLGQARQIIDVGNFSAFLWSPDGTQLAVGDQPNPRIPYFNRLMLVPVGGQPVTSLSTEEVMAFYWAPTGDKLAWVTINAADQEIEWMVSPSDGSGAKRLFGFQPSGEGLIMLSFFDQYAYSHSPWSPDGKSLVVAGSQRTSARGSNGRTPTGDRIYVLDAEGDTAPLDLGAGVLAFWSWN